MKPISCWILITGFAICQIAEANSYTPIGSSLSTTAWTEARDAESPPRRRMTNSELVIVNSGIKIKFAGNDFIKRDELFDPKKTDGAGRSNVERMREGLAPLGKDGHPINLHHMKQQNNGMIVEASHTEHKNNSVSWHRYSRISEIDRDRFNYLTRPTYWKERAKDFELRGRNAGYISLGAAAAMAMGPELWDLLNTGSLTDQTWQPTGHAVSIIAAERFTTLTLSKFGNGAIQGMRGNAIIALTILATDTAWSVYEHGGTRAFQNEGFYINLGGSIGSLVGIPVVFAVTGMTGGNFIIGGLAGFGVATAGYFVGRPTTRKILEIVRPEFLYKAEDTAIADAQKNINDSISRIQQGLDS